MTTDSETVATDAARILQDRCGMNAHRLGGDIVVFALGADPATDGWAELARFDFEELGESITLGEYMPSERPVALARAVLRNLASFGI